MQKISGYTAMAKEQELTVSKGLCVCGDLQGTASSAFSLICQLNSFMQTQGVSADVGKVAIKRGPIVYCLEEVDNGAELQCIYLSGKAAQKKKSTYFSECLELELQGRRLIPRNGELYSSAGLTYEDAVVRAIPYAYWNNRGEGEMLVWIHEMIGN